jgi:hypothetical protein
MAIEQVGKVAILLGALVILGGVPAILVYVDDYIPTSNNNDVLTDTTCVVLGTHSGYADVIVMIKEPHDTDITIIEQRLDVVTSPGANITCWYNICETNIVTGFNGSNITELCIKSTLTNFVYEQPFPIGNIQAMIAFCSTMTGVSLLTLALIGVKYAIYRS